MCKESDKNKDKKTFSDWLIIVMYIIIALAVLCCTIGFFWHPFEYPNEDGLVITFLGALAAFVVISNYAQISELNRKNKERIRKLENKIKQSNFFDEGFKIIVDRYVKLRLVEIIQDKKSKFTITPENIKDYRFIENGKVIVKTEEVKRIKRSDGSGYDILNGFEIKYYLVDLLNKEISFISASDIPE